MVPVNIWSNVMHYSVSFGRAMHSNICVFEHIMLEFGGEKLRWEYFGKSTSTTPLAYQNDPAVLNYWWSFMKKTQQKSRFGLMPLFLHEVMLIEKWQHKPFYYVRYQNINKGSVSFIICLIFYSVPKFKKACLWLVH